MSLDALNKIKNDLDGFIGVNFKDNDSLDSWCAKNVDNFEPSRFEAIALRIYMGKEFLITLYALDKSRQESDSQNPDKLPVKKFKVDASLLQNIMSHIAECNLTLSTGAYPIEDMEVINR